MEIQEGIVGLVIGGGSGIGRGVSLALGAAGVTVVVADIDEVWARAIRDEIRARGGTAESEYVDSTETPTLERLADNVESNIGPVQILSNHVGILNSAPLIGSTDNDWGWAFEFNVMSLVRANNVFVPRMRKHGLASHIVNTSSTCGILAVGPADAGGFPIGVYNATKHAVLGYVETLRAELAPEGIGVSVLIPGTVNTNIALSSARNRPARYGGPYAYEQTEPSPADGLEGGGPLGPFVVQAIRENRKHVLTHPEWSPKIIERHDALMDDFDYWRKFKENADRWH